MAAARTGVGPLIRERRASAHRSQLDVALDVGVSARHLSFVELGKARRTRNFDQWSAYLLRQLDLVVRRTRSAEAEALAAEIEEWPGIAPRETWSRWTPRADDPVMPWILEHSGVELSMYTVMATLGTP